ncbi:MAG TPA: NAD(P)/FAD-dependent oxidoreductase, partial [Acidimicrobiales bacterium]|nr:NAD(P)/FAD-dependent oxidoreductase [Acidimicrobiales bacterium]
PGLSDFTGEVVRTAHWPEPGPVLDGRRIGLIGTSASGVQSAPHLAEAAAHLTIFQRTPHYSAPAHNVMLDPARIDAHLARAETLWEEIVAHPGGTDIPLPAGRARNFTAAEQLEILEARWAYGAHALGSVFTDQGTDAEVNEIVASYVRGKIAEKIGTKELAERVMPTAYPIGTHRLAVDVSYYETFNRDNVTLVSLLDDPIDRIVPTGVRLRSGRVVELDLLVLATGFHSITGALYAATLTGVAGVALRDHWARGPMAYLGLMTRGFPNLFLPTGPGSPSVLANMFADNEQHIDLAAGVIEHMAAQGFTTVQPTAEAEEWWRQEMRAVSEPLLRYRVDNYMVHVNADDQSRVFMPYPGGFDRFVRACDEVVAAGFEGFEFG